MPAESTVFASFVWKCPSLWNCSAFVEMSYFYGNVLLCEKYPGQFVGKYPAQISIISLDLLNLLPLLYLIVHDSQATYYSKQDATNWTYLVPVKDDKSATSTVSSIRTAALVTYP
jgi:hypothetical protein